MSALAEEGKNTMKKLIRNIVIILLLIVMVSAYGGYRYYNTLGLPVDINDSKVVDISIPKGSSTAKIAGILEENGLIRNELYFRYVSTQRNVGQKYQAGHYKLNKSLSVDEIIEKLANGDVYVETVKFTIPEGFEIQQIIDRLVSIEGLNLNKDKLLEIMKNEDFGYKFLHEIPKGEDRLEGYLFPDTYEVLKDVKERDIVVMMLNRFDRVFKEEYYHRAKELNMSIEEVITLASIIEREARVDRERPVISSVFHNRLKKDMLLQSCATIQYALGERKEKLTYKDLEIESPYNTYTNLGLPPSPIASPGETSIKAALYPEDTSYLYFVARGDGSHVFNKTYQGHIKSKNENN